MVTCIQCRGTIDDGGHLLNCPVLDLELETYRLLAEQSVAKGLTKPS